AGNDDDAYLCRELYKEGLTISVIAEKMEMSRSQVFNIIYRGN
ncbi:helix-turn-helix domain-containing protein, partial [Citrobacter freundii]